MYLIRYLIKILLFVLLIGSGQLYAQWNLVLEITVKSEGKGFQNAIINLLEKDSVVESLNPDKKGKASVILDPDKLYLLEVEGPDSLYVKKKLFFDTKNVPEGRYKGNTYFPMHIDVFRKMNSKLKYKELDSSVAKIAFVPSVNNFDIVSRIISSKEKDYNQRAIISAIEENDTLNKKVNSLQDRLTMISNELKNKNKEILLKNKELRLKKAEITTKEIELKTVSYEVGVRKEDLYNTLTSLKKQEIELKKSKEEYQLQNEVLEQQKEELEIALMNLDEAKTEYETTREQVKAVNKMLDDQRHITFIAISILIVITLLGGLAYRNYRVQKKQALVIQEQKEQVEEQNREITDSITYAKRIQEAILPPLKLVKSYLVDSFIFYKPKDIVAGDFYWMEASEDWVYFAAADCTGHGVPGAMVSVVCSNALNRSVREYELKTPSTILDKTLEIVIERFEKSEEEVKDGMDISLCAYNTKTKVLQYAGAHNPLWIIRKGSEEVEEIKGDKQPVGKYAEQKPFTNHKLNLNQGDSIYLFSDGYIDQFGGERGKKFKSVNFKKLLLSIKDKSIQEQYISIKETFDTWKGDLEQLDDVCVIGFRA